LFIKKQLKIINNAYAAVSYKFINAFYSLPTLKEINALYIFRLAEARFKILPVIIKALLIKTELVFLAISNDVAKVPEY
jgi:hypothetical protein